MAQNLSFIRRTGGNRNLMIISLKKTYCCKLHILPIILLTILFSVKAYGATYYIDNSGSKTHPVGTKKPNELGIYDMSGNVYEWCWDWYNRGYYEKSPKDNPKGAIKSSSRVRRGGSWDFYASGVRCAYRNYSRAYYRNYDIGFRL